MKYRLLGPAIDDLDHIDAWVSTNFGQAAAIRARQQLNDTFLLLARFQSMGIEQPETTTRAVRFFSSHPNWIVYEPGEPLVIHRIFPAAQNVRTLKL